MCRYQGAFARIASEIWGRAAVQGGVGDQKGPGAFYRFVIAQLCSAHNTCGIQVIRAIMRASRRISSLSFTPRAASGRREYKATPVRVGHREVWLVSR
jgi:hypothetical protein